MLWMGHNKTKHEKTGMDCFPALLCFVAHVRVDMCVCVRACMYEGGDFSNHSTFICLQMSFF